MLSVLSKRPYAQVAGTGGELTLPLPQQIVEGAAHRPPPLESGRVSSRATRFFGRECPLGTSQCPSAVWLHPGTAHRGRCGPLAQEEDRGSERRDSGARVGAVGTSLRVWVQVTSRTEHHLCTYKCPFQALDVRARSPRTQDTSYRQKERWEPRVRAAAAAASLPDSPAPGGCSLPETLEATLRPSAPMALCLALARAVPSACHTLPWPPELPVPLSPVGSLPQPQLLELLEAFAESRS